MLSHQLKQLELLPKHIRDQIAVNICDDGSPAPSQAIGRPIGLPLAIFRIDVDIRWNQDAAKNICVKEAMTPWLLLTDIDHMIPEGTWRSLLKPNIDPMRVYRFSRETLNPDFTLTPYKPHPNSWFMSRQMYEKIGGYDERFAGFYGSDAAFRNDVVKYAGEPAILKASIYRVPRDTVPDASTTHYLRKQPIDSEGMARIGQERKDIAYLRPLRFLNEYRRVYPE